MRDKLEGVVFLHRIRGHRAIVGKLGLIIVDHDARSLVLRLKFGDFLFKHRVHNCAGDKHSRHTNRDDREHSHARILHRFAQNDMHDGNERPDRKTDPYAVKRRRGDVRLCLLEKAQLRRERGFAHERIVADESDCGETHCSQEQGKTKHIEHDFERAVQLDLFVLLSLAHNFLLIDLGLPSYICASAPEYDLLHYHSISKNIFQYDFQ